MLRLDHVNVGVPDDGLDAEARFLVDVIGLRHLEQGVDSPAEANWFESDAGFQIHVSRDPDHRPAARAHVAIDYGDGLDEVHQRLDAQATEYRTIDPGDGIRRLVAKDPAGNTWELRGNA